MSAGSLTGSGSLIVLFLYHILCLQYVTSQAEATAVNIPVVSPLNFSGLFPFGIAEGDQFGPRGDDSATDPVILDIPFTFFGKEYTEIIVNSNGVLSFDDTFTDFRQRRFPFNSPPLIAPFWDDFHPDSEGQISYRLTNDSDDLLHLHRLLLGLDIESIAEDSFHPKQIFVATWDDVLPFGYYFGYPYDFATVAQQRNTLQVLLATDGLQTIAVFVYDNIQWGAGAQIGFNAGEGHTYHMLSEALTSQTLDMSNRSNVDQPGVFVFRIDNLGVVECTASLHCSGPVLGNMTSFECCVGNASGMAYKKSDSETCHKCIVFGWLENSLVGEERESSYLAQAGYIKGAHEVGKDLVFDIQSQNSDDFTILTGQIRIPYESSDPQNVSMVFRVDGVSQERDETVTLKLVPSENFETHIPTGESVFFKNDLDVTILDNDTLEIYLSQSEFRSSEADGVMAITVCKSKKIGSVVEVKISPVTIDDILTPEDIGIPPSLPSSPNRADLNDFSQSERYLFFYPHDSFSCHSQYITITDDAINEAAEQLFAIRLSLVYSRNPSMVVMSQNISMGIIIDDDPISIGFEQEQYTFFEPPSRRQFDISIVKENGRRSEQTFEVIVDASSNMTNPYHPASPDEDYDHDLTRVLFPPNQESIAWSFGLVSNEDRKENSAFRVTISPNFTESPTFTSRGSLFNETLIVIQDAQNRIGFGQSVYTVHESSGQISIPIFSYINVASSDDLTANFTTFGGTAVEGLDYETTSMTLDLIGNQTDDIIIPILDDMLAEGYETFGGKLQVESQSLNLSYFESEIRIEIIDDEVEGVCGNMPSSGECSADALCKVSTNGRSISGCVCREGFRGNGFICLDIDECSIGQHDCHSNAQCINTHGSFECNCNEGYFGNGTLCIESGSQVNGSCSDNCTCFNTSSSSGWAGDTVCGCLPGYKLQTIDGVNATCQDINECSDSNLCNGTCENTIGSYNCYCPSGYMLNSNGSLCVDIDECDLELHECDRNARCKNTIGNYTCTCTEDYFGNGYSCSMECNMAACEQNCTSRGCGCRPGYYLLPDRKSCADIDECKVYRNDICDTNAKCINTQGSYECQCKTGYQGNGFICKDINECETGEHDCDENRNLICINKEGSFNCKCNDSDGTHCNDRIAPIIAIADTPVKDLHINNHYTIGRNFCIESVDTLREVFIACPLENDPSPPPQFNITVTRILTANRSEPLLSGLTKKLHINDSLLPMLFDNDTLRFVVNCTVSNSVGNTMEITNVRICDKTECQEGITNNCSQTCIRNVSLSGISSYECGCYEGYSRNEIHTNLCEDFDECLNNSTNDCTEAEMCINNNGSYTCECKQGYEWLQTGQTCEDIDECSTEIPLHNCSENETCSNNPGGFSCDCNVGFERDHEMLCEDIDECANDTLNNCTRTNHEQCVNTLGSFNCECEPGFENTMMLHCQDVDECSSNHNCTHGCENTEGSYLCKCPKVHGFILEDNSTCLDIDECAEETDNCHSYAMCTNTYGGYNCTCKAPYEGDGQNCEVSGTILSIISATSVGSLLLAIVIVMCILAYFKHHTTKKSMRRLSRNYNAIKDRKFSVQSSFKLKLPPPLIVEASTLKLVESVGEGEFGIVYRGQLQKAVERVIQTRTVAVKTLKGFYDSNAVKELLRECSKMYKFDHPNVLSLIGVCLDGGTAPFLIVPFMDNGSLLAYLKNHRKTIVISAENEEYQDAQVVRKRLTDMCIQVAKGMKYLSSMNVVHRDLAARNCMIDINMVIKVADFGLSESVGTKRYFRQDKDAAIRLPIKWLAPESMEDYVFSEKSDVWAYGITCWEVFSGGKVPYPSINVVDLPTQLREGHRLARPSHSACNQEMYEIMLHCWNLDPQERPTFAAIVASLSNLLEVMVDYTDIGGTFDDGERMLTDNSPTITMPLKNDIIVTENESDTYIEMESVAENNAECEADTKM